VQPQGLYGSGLDQLIRKASVGKSFPKRASGEASLQSIITTMGLQTVQKGLCFLRTQTVAGFLMLVELCNAS
jgi:hypothetical protein